MCLNPILLRNGQVVSCGKCLSCLNASRNEWSVRTQLHSTQFEMMPFFVRLSYNDENLPFSEKDGTVVLNKKDVQDFIMRFRFNNNLVNTKFSYFGCGEYGEDEEHTHRPHYHLILFGADFLYDVYDRSIHAAEDIVTKTWKKGFCDVQVCRSAAAIHYTTKYTLKKVEDDHTVRPFTLASKGIGACWFDSLECKEIRSKLDKGYIMSLYKSAPRFYMGYDVRESLANANLILKHLQPISDLFRVTLPSGVKCAMPRYYRKKILGSFEHFKDNPLWYLDFIKDVKRCCEESIMWSDYNSKHSTSMQYERALAYERRLKKLITFKSLNVI